MSLTFNSLLTDLTRDFNRVQPRDALQFCANWFQSRLEEQRARTRDLLADGSVSNSFPTELYSDSLGYRDSPSANAPPILSPYPRPTSSIRSSVSHSPFGTLNVAGNALLGQNSSPPLVRHSQNELPPTSPLTNVNPFGSFDNSAPTPVNASDFLHPPSSSIFARRTSVSAESIALDSGNDEPLPVYPKTEEQIRRIKASTKSHFLFRDLDEEQESGVLNAMQERRVVENEVVIRQGDVGEYFYVVESGFLNVFIRPEPLPPNWLQQPNIVVNNTNDKFKFRSEFGRLVQECKAGSCFGELALMYGHPRAASVVAMEASTLWSLDRITFRTIILKAAHRKRTMYEQFLSTVNLLSSLDPPERSKIADALVSSVYVDGEAVVRQGQMGDTFFFIEEGEAIVTKAQQNENGEIREIKVGHLKKGDYFGGE